MPSEAYRQQRANMMATYAPAEVVFTHGEGCYLYDENGDQYLDFIAGIAVSSLGHSHAKLVDTLTEQAKKLWHLSNLFRIPEGERLARRLCTSSFGDRVFLTNSGTEAVECGLKMIRRYHFDNGQPEKYRIIGMHGSFHGRSIAAISAAGNPSYVKGFTRGDEGYDHVPFNDIDALKAAITKETAGIIVEPVQGEGGLCVSQPGYLQAMREFCNEHGILLMFDEIQCGIGRTGTLYAHQQHDVTPDIMAIAKGIGSGFPMGACIASENVAAPMVVGTHGSTFGGNPLASAVGNAVLDIINDDLLQQVRDNGEVMKAGLQQLKQRFPQFIAELRGQGLMQGVCCINIENLQILNQARERNLLIGRAGDNCVRLMPPLIIDTEQINHAINILHSVFEHFDKT